MYRYDQFDDAFVRQRAAQFRDQVARRLDGSLTEEEFKPLRLMNGLYLQLHAYMLRVAIPYGTLGAAQMRALADIAQRYDRGYGHFTTRQNIQFNWPKLSDAPDIIDALADVGMHAIQTSGNCIRNTTSDPFAGVAADELEDPRPTAELIRQWSSLHPEFTFLGRKFKIAVTGAENDRTALRVHDIGIEIIRGPTGDGAGDGAGGETGEIGYRLHVGGGLGRTPMIARPLRDFLPRRDLLPYLEAVLRVYNLQGRRDNKYKARIKILVHEMGIAAFRDAVEAEFARLDGATIAPDAAEIARIAAYFAPPDYQSAPRMLDYESLVHDDADPAGDAALARARAKNPDFDAWATRNAHPHKTPGHAAATISLKPVGRAPGDATAEQMRAMAEAAERFSLGELRITHEQNVVLPHVARRDLPALWRLLRAHGLDAPNRGLITDIIACPGLDYCALATARSIPVAQAISRRFADPARQRDIGPLSVKISGCINACGHHHVGHIGILGLDKAGVESYQITIGGDPTNAAALGERAGPGFSFDQVPDVIETLVDHYLSVREGRETFLQTYRRTGMAGFKEALYAAA